ncbi:MAG: V-type ATP synthase subunit E [Spirochaetales bacterium]|jgi:V/A-type H+-transporting ATPase subunit E|nr:V-type ATP synthase subunit E [Spirochaetales bacterium]
MDIQLKELIETIKKEGIDSADSKAAQIIAEAEAKGKAIVARAEEEASRLLADAKREIARGEQSSREALTQAARDLLLSLQKRITALFDSVVKTEAAAALQGKALEDTVAHIVKAWADKGASDIEVLLPQAELAKIDSALRSRLAEELKKGVQLKPVSQIEAGFRIGEKDGSSYYDFTADGVAEVLAEYLNPKLAEIMKSANKEV